MWRTWSMLWDRTVVSYAYQVLSCTGLVSRGLMWQAHLCENRIYETGRRALYKSICIPLFGKIPWNL